MFCFAVKRIPTETTIHTHPGKKEYDDGWARPSSEDKRYFGTYTPNKAFMYWDMMESYIKELYLKIIRINISLYIKFLL